jgi:Protein of unknown function (DUF995)
MPARQLRNHVKGCYKADIDQQCTQILTQLRFNVAVVSGETKMTMTTKPFAALTLASLLLAGCTSMNIFKDNPESAAPPPEEQVMDAAPPSAKSQASAGMSASAISKALSGKSWKWQGPKNSGVTLFANDGSSLVEVTGKGTTTGKWLAKDGQLCEQFSAAPFLPNGVPLTCQPFAASGANSYRYGQATFTLAL